MVNAQEYLNTNYPKEEREKITELKINTIPGIAIKSCLEGDLDL
ncbi:15570_t:CDS:1, partial [Entrophospora sp. SA101]